VAGSARSKTSLAVFATALALAATLPLAFAGNAHAAPNILFIVTDDQELQGTMAVMPSTAKWFKNGDPGAGITGGTDFVNASVTTPLCCPSRSSIFTGRYAHNHGVHKTTEPQNLDQTTTLQRYLQQAGYRTGIFGKFLNNWDVKVNPPYWSDWAIYDAQLYAGFEVNEQGSRKRNWKYSTNYLTEKAEEFLQSAETTNDAQPWFMYVAPTTPHGPYDPEPKYTNAAVPQQPQTAAYFEQDRSDKPFWSRTAAADADGITSDYPAHLRMLKTADDLVERIMQKLRSLNEDQETLAFFISDNGYQWGEHGVRFKNVPYRESIRVPMYLRWPGWSGHSGTRTDIRLAANIDLAPTALAAAGVTQPASMDGRSLLDTNGSRARILTEGWGAGNGTGSPCPGVSPTWSAINTLTFHYIEYYETLPVGSGGCSAGNFTTNYNNVVDREYYDVTPGGDPLELTNLFGDSDPTNDPPVGELSASLASARTCSGTSCAEAPSDPDTRITERPASVSGSSSATFSFTSSEPNSAFECRLDASGNQPFLPCPARATWVGLSNGSHTLEARAIDSAGVRDSTPDTITWTVDTSFPETWIGDGPPDPSTIREATFEFGGSGTSTAFQCRLDSDLEADFQYCSTPQSYDSLADGSHTFDVRALRAPAQVDPTPARHTWTVDATPPNTEVTPASTLSTHSDFATFNLKSNVSDSSAQAETPSRLECKLDGGAYAPCGYSKTYEDLSKGAHTVRARSTDQAGNTDPTPAAFSWTIGTVQTFSSSTDNTWPQVTVGNEVRVVLPDKSGGFYIAGDFSEIGFPGGPRWQRTDLAHIKADRTVDEAWRPSTDGGSVRALVAIGSTYYLGGTFTGIKGSNDSSFTSRNRLAAVNAAGNLTTWNPNASNAVHALAPGLPLATGQYVPTLYAAGAFNYIGSVIRRKIAEINLSDGTVTPWNPDANGSATLQALATNQRYVYAGGSGLTQIGGKPRVNLAEIDRFTGQATAWNPNPNGLVLALGSRQQPVGGLPTVYAGGTFTTIGLPPAARNRAAEINITDDGSPTAWDPSPANWPQAFYALGCTLRCTVILGGAFTSLESTSGSPVSRGRLADTDLITGDPQDWNPGLDLPASSFACATSSATECNGTLAVGGTFNSSGGAGGIPLVARSRLAFYNLCPLAGPC
jgi:arylsulfatase A-like enzyme